MDAKVEESKLMTYGYTERILHVDLTSRSFQVRDIDRHELRHFIGGGGYNAWLLYRKIIDNSDIDPLGPDNPLIFGVGPLVGTSFPTSSRCSFTALSPLTGIFGESNGGGLTGVTVKRSGIDHMVITGASETPCTLVIGDSDGCRIEAATDLWGLNTQETEETIQKKYPKAAMLAIGPAGENLVRYACISSYAKGNVFGRTGMGAVMGSKRLKAIVALGGRDISVKESETLKHISKKILRGTKSHSRLKLFRHYGNAMLLNMLASRGLMFGENWRRRLIPEDVTSLDVGSYGDATLSKSLGCFRCPLTCKRMWKIKEGEYRDEEGHGYEIAHILSFGLTLGIRDVPTILHLIKKCNHMGFDLLEFSGAVGMAVDAYKQGFLSRETADNLRLDWNDGHVVDALIEKVGKREGIGDLLAEGTKNSARAIGPGAEQYALHMKGMHWPAHSAPPFIMAFSLSPRGGNLKGLPHLLLQNNNSEIISKLFGATKKTGNIYTHDDKGRAVWWHENYKVLIDGLGTCFWLSVMALPHGDLFPDELARAYTAATGLETSGTDIMQSAERVYQIQRAINALRGLTGKDDAFTKRPEPDSWGHGVDLHADGMLNEYYAYRGLSSDGQLTRRRLEEISLGSVAGELEKRHLLSATDSGLPISTIMRNPDGAELGKKWVSKLVGWVEKRMMTKMEDPKFYRRFFEKQGAKTRKKRFRNNAKHT
jgi:aldehyde:ferredoxin oxidoreductase